MARKLLVIVAVAAISVFCLSGCKKSSSEPESEQEEVKTVAEYEAEAREQIDTENMDEELESIEKALQQETAQEQ